MGDDRSKISQSMYGLRVNAEIGEVLHEGMEICDQVARPDRGKLPMVEVY